MTIKNGYLQFIFPITIVIDSVLTKLNHSSNNILRVLFIYFVFLEKKLTNRYYLTTNKETTAQETLSTTHRREVNNKSEETLN